MALATQELARLEQQSFEAGMFRSVARHLIPPNAAYDLRNTVLDEDGTIYERGGTANRSNANFSSSPLRFLWAGQLGPGERILFADQNDFGVLSGDGVTPLNLGGVGMPDPKRAVEIAGVLFIAGGWLYGGSRKTADYATGTVTTTNASKTVTGAGTTWSTNVDPGMLFRIAGERYYVVESVDSNTQITLRDAYQGSTGGGKSYTLTILGSAASTPYRVSDFYVAVSDRLLSLEGNRVYVSDVTVPDPADATSGQGPHKWSSTDYHELPEGVRILGGWDVGSTALIFTTRGTFAIIGLGLDLTDSQGTPQRKVDHVNPDLVLWGNQGIAAWRSTLVVPALDGVWLVDGVSAPLSVSDSIEDLYRSYVESGYKPGLASVFKGHYVLPILSQANSFVDLLICRLDRPVRASRRRTIYPWSHFDGSGANVSAFATRVSSPIPDPELLGAQNAATARILDCSGYFDPSALTKRDSDGTDFAWDVILRDIEIGLVKTQTKMLRLLYELQDAASDDPKISAFYATGIVVTGGSEWGLSDWGQADWNAAATAQFIAIPGSAPEDPEGNDPYTFPLNVRTRYLRLRLYSKDPTPRLALRGVEVFVRPTGKL